MNQVDKIIFQNLTLLGWEPEREFNSLKELEVSDIAELLIKCLESINSEKNLPSHFPHNVTQKFRVAGQISENIKELGYKGIIGYQSILYPNETELRQIFSFLIEQLPRDSPTLAKQPTGARYSILRKAQDVIKEDLENPWFPPPCRTLLRKCKYRSNEEVSLFRFGCSLARNFSTNRLFGPNALSWLNAKEKDVNSFVEEFFAEDSTFFPSLVSLLACTNEDISYCSSSDEENDRFSATPPKSPLKHADDPTENTPLPYILDVKSSEIVATAESEAFRNESADPATVGPIGGEKRSEILATVRKRHAELSSHIACADRMVLDCQLSINEVESELQRNDCDLGTERNRLDVLKRTSALAADSSTIIEKLKGSLSSLKEKEARLHDQWQQFKQPLDQQTAQCREQLLKKNRKKSAVLSEIEESRVCERSLQAATKEKQRRLARLRDQTNRARNGQNRSVYTKQILDICDKVQKQKKETEKIIEETRVVQKDMNALTGKIERAFAVAEDATYKVAVSDASARPVYRLVVAVHEECARVVEVIRECGSIQRESASLLQQLNGEKAKNIEESLTRVKEDYVKLKRENEALKTR